LSADFRHDVDMDGEPAKGLTALLRSSDMGFWIRLRQLLAEKGIDPEVSVLAQIFQDDMYQEFGIILLPERKVFEFVVQYEPGDAEHEGAGTYIREWDETTESWQDRPFREEVWTALNLIESEER
jgi:hypothetical protein